MKYKVLVIGSYKSSGNSSRPSAHLILGLKRSGVVIDVMMPGDTYYEKMFREAGIQVFKHQITKKISFSTIRYIRRLVKQNDYHLLHLYNNKAAINGVLATTGLPVKLLTYRGFTGHVSWFNPTSLLTHLNPKVKRVTCVSNAVCSQVRGQLLINRDKKPVTVYKGHDLHWYRGIQPVKRNSIDVPDQAFMVTLVANARAMKGIEYFIRASNHLSGYEDIHFVLVGRHMDSSKYLKLIEQSPLRDHFHLTGFRSDSMNIMASSNVIVLSSIKGEGLSRTTIEAMSLSKPMIATDIGGNAELVIHKKTGLLIPPKSPKAIAEAILTYKGNPAFAKNMGLNAKKHIATNFPIEKSIRRMKQVYETVAAE